MRRHLDLEGKSVGISSEPLGTEENNEPGYRAIADWLEILRERAENDPDLTLITREEVLRSLGHAEAALRRAQAEKRVTNPWYGRFGRH